MAENSDMIKRNITLKQYIEIVEKSKSAALYDLDSIDIFELHNSQNQIFSVLGVKLFCRDDKDCSWVLGHDNYELFLRFNPNLMKYIQDESRYLLEDDESFREPIKDRLYWEITKYIKIKDNMCRMYVAYFSLNCELLGVSWHLDYSQKKIFADDSYILHKHGSYIKLSAAQYFLHNSKKQLISPFNVELPYQPGDILYIDARPFGKPFYAVYCAETDAGKEHFEWTLQEYGYFKRSHPCLYISEDHNGLDISNLTNGGFTDYIAFPYSPLDKIKKVNTCDNYLLSKASAMLKVNPDVFYQWIEIKETHPLQEDGGLEQWIFNL